MEHIVKYYGTLLQDNFEKGIVEEKHLDSGSYEFNGGVDNLISDLIKKFNLDEGSILDCNDHGLGDNLIIALTLPFNHDGAELDPDLFLKGKVDAYFASYNFRFFQLEEHSIRLQNNKERLNDLKK